MKIFKFSTNPIFMFIYAILSKWYMIMLIPAIVTVFWVFKGLESSGLLQKFEHVIIDVTDSTKAVARYCVPKIPDLQSFFSCLQNTPKYEELNAEKDLYNEIKKNSPTKK